MVRDRGRTGSLNMKKLFTLILLLAAFPLHAEEAPNRIVAAGGSLTEIIYALGEEKRLVGVDVTSYYPEAAKKLPQVGYVRSLSAEGILSLKPDMVLVNKEAGPPAVLEQLKQTNVKLEVVETPSSVEGAEAKIGQVAKLLGVPEKGKKLNEALALEQKKLTAELKKNPAQKRVLFILQHGGGAPLVAGKDTEADAIIKLAGAKNVVDAFDGFKPLTPEAAAALKPEVILVTTQTLDQVGGKEGLLKLPALALTEAGKQGKVIAMDAMYLLGFGPRTVKAATELHQQLTR